MTEEDKAALEVLQSNVRIATKNYDSLRILESNEISRAKAEITDKYAPEMKRLSDLCWQAIQTYEQVRDEMALKSQPLYPIGTHMILMEYKEGKWSPYHAPVKRYSWDRKPDPTQALFEIVVKGTVFPSNTKYWCKPDVGTPILRFLKKDGKPGLLWRTFSPHVYSPPRDGIKEWFPLGADMQAEYDRRLVKRENNSETY